MFKFDQNADLDLLYCLVTMLLAILVLIIFLINPVAVPATIERKAEYMASVEWDKKVDCDVDLHLLLPSGGHVFFAHRDHKVASLERDDLGVRTDLIKSKAGGVAILENLEVIMIRAILPGEYIFGAHLYNCYRTPTSAVKVDFTLSRLNPRFEHVITKTVYLEHRNQQKTFARLFIDKNGYAVTDDSDHSYKFEGK